MNDPLKNLIKSSDYIKGMRDAQSASDERLLKILDKFYLFSTQIKESLESARVPESNNLLKYAIYHDNRMLNKLYVSKNEAWNAIMEICGDKIDFRKSKYSVKKLVH